MTHPTWTNTFLQDPLVSKTDKTIDTLHCPEIRDNQGLKHESELFAQSVGDEKGGWREGVLEQKSSALGMKITK
jgi:hypothetical protein